MRTRSCKLALQIDLLGPSITLIQSIPTCPLSFDIEKEDDEKDVKKFSGFLLALGR